MKKIICVLLSLVFIFSLVSCNTEPQIVVSDPNAGYTIEKEDGEYYLVMDEIYSGADDSLNCEVHPEIHFKSVKEMRDSILNGTLTEEQKNTIAKFSKDENGKIIIFDLNNLFQPILPSDLEWSYTSWSGRTTYYYGIDGNRHFCVFDELTYKEIYQREYIDHILNNHLVTVIKTETESERNATVYYTETSVAEIKFIVYKIPVENGELWVFEKYILSNSLSHTIDSIKCSDTIPSHVKIFGNVNGGYFKFWEDHPAERPEVEWLSQFGVEPVEFE